MRDPVQHALPLIETAPHIAKSVLRYTLKEMMPNFHTMDPNKISSLPYAMVGRGLIDNGGGGWKADPQAQRYFPDDLDCYLLLCASEYLLATKDKAFLRERLPFWNSNRTQTVLEALQRSVDFITEEIGAGKHGIMRMLSSDWDDGFGAKDLVPPSAYNVSESVLTASLATVVLPRIAAVLEELGGDKTGAAKARRFAEAQRRNILRHAFNGRWLRRAWLSNATGWVGDIPQATPGIPILGYSGVFSAQHGWAFAGGVFDDDAAALNATLASLHEHCRKPYAFGYAYICGPLEDPHPPTPQRRRLQFSDAPGMWPAVNYPTVLGLAAINRTDLAWEEFVRNSLHWQASVSPHIWTGIWTSADSVNADGLPSDWTNNFPGLCMHRHAWPLLALRQLAGLHFTAEGLLIRPAIPAELGPFRYSTSLASLSFDGVGTWTGHYTPATVGEWTVRADMRNVLPAGTPVSLSVTAAGVSGNQTRSHASILEARAPAVAGLRFSIRASTHTTLKSDDPVALGMTVGRWSTVLAVWTASACLGLGAVVAASACAPDSDRSCPAGSVTRPHGPNSPRGTPRVRFLPTLQARLISARKSWTAEPERETHVEMARRKGWAVKPEPEPEPESEPEPEPEPESVRRRRGTPRHRPKKKGKPLPVLDLSE